MALQDFETFIQERLRSYDGTLDLTSGSPIDVQVIQPLLRRIGTDPFTVDAATFIVERLGQEFPDLAYSDGDAVSDLLTKPALLLWDPIIREIQRVKNSLSFKTPETLTTEEADALGANIFATRRTGAYAYGKARMYFTQPQSITVNSSNFFTTSEGLHFFPSTIQSISASEMQMNTESDLFYFDVDLIAEGAGDAYNIEPSKLVTVANISSAVRVTNKARFTSGVPEEDAFSFIGRVDQELSEKSLVTVKGIAAQLSRSFPDLTRMNVVGFQDPEMQRDILSGGSLGPMLGFGADARTAPDGEYRGVTRRVRCPSADFFSLIGPAGPVTGYTITLFDMFLTAPVARDLPVTRVIDMTTLEVGEQVLAQGSLDKAWCLRKLELNISGIPGGILYPQTASGAVTVTPDTVHIGGCSDIFIKGISLDTGSLTLDVLSDQDPDARGNLATTGALSPAGSFGYIQLGDFYFGNSYGETDQLYKDLEQAAKFNLSIAITDGPDAGAYRVLNVFQILGANPVLQVTPSPSGVPGTWRWKLLKEISMDLVEPKEIRLSGSNGKSVQNVDLFSTDPPTDFSSLGVAANDILRVFSGTSFTDYVITAVDPPLYTQLKLDRVFADSKTGLTFSVFRNNSSGGITRPLIRLKNVSLLDTSGQPVGTTIPYAKPVQALSRAFQNFGDGIKAAVRDGVLGIVSMPQPTPGWVFTGQSLQIVWDEISPITIALAGTLTAQQVVDQINALTVSAPAIGMEVAFAIPYNGASYLGIVPVGTNTRVLGAATGVLFGAVGTYRSDLIRSATTNWSSIDPSIDDELDCVWVVDGVQSGIYSTPVVSASPSGIQVNKAFGPEVGRTLYLGSRSLGSARVYFLEPTSAEVDQDSVFTAVDSSGNALNYKPDPTLARQLLPALPNGSKPKDGVCTNSGLYGVLQLPGTDFLVKGIKPGDLVHLDYRPIVGSVNLADPVLSLAYKQLRISLDDQPDKVITFMNDVGTTGAVTREGVANQINSALGLLVCSVEEVSTNDFRLVFNPTLSVNIRAQSASAYSANLLLGFSNTADTKNASANAGTYQILEVAFGGDTSKVRVTPSFPSSGTTQEQFEVTRRGSQRISATEMQAQVEDGLYYWDVELVSEGPGNLWNIPASLEMTLSGYRSDGYYLTTEDPNLTFSPLETVSVRFSSKILPLGVDDDQENSIQLEGQSVAFEYEYSDLVSSVHSFVTADSERVINQSPLTRHLLPHFVRFGLAYTGGSSESVVRPVIENYVESRQPDQGVLASDLQKILTDKGASYVVNPLNLMAVVYNFDRTVTLTRSQDSLTTGRLSAFIADSITLSRNLATFS